MKTDETTKKESTNQPTEPSTPEENQEELQDQPTKEVEEDEPTESVEEEESITIDGQTYGQEEAKELLGKGKHFTYEMQQLREKERLLAQAAQQPTTNPTEEETEIAEARKTLKRYGVVTEDQMDAKFKELQLKQVRQSQFASFRRDHPEINDFNAKMIEGAAYAWGMTYEEAYTQSTGNQKKVVRKKTVGASRKATTPVSDKGGGVITRADIAVMTTEEYKKNLPKIEQLMRDGELK